MTGLHQGHDGRVGAPFAAAQIVVGRGGKEQGQSGTQMSFEGLPGEKKNAGCMSPRPNVPNCSWPMSGAKTTA